MKKQETKEVARSGSNAAADAYLVADARGPPHHSDRLLIRRFVTLWLIVKLTGVILLLVLSIFFAYFVSPLVEFLQPADSRFAGRKSSMPRAAGNSRFLFTHRWSHRGRNLFSGAATGKPVSGVYGTSTRLLDYGWRENAGTG